MFNDKYKKRILFVGIPDMAYVCLDGLYATGVDIVGVMGPKTNHPTYSAFKSYVEEKNLNYIEWDDLSSATFLEKIRQLNVDVAVVCSFNYKIPRELLNSVKDGFINIHPSLLPNYRGGNPYSTVLINGEKETGVTIHFMDEGFDTGDIIYQKKVEISEVETMGTLFNRLNLLGMEMLVEVLTMYENSTLPRYKQPEGEFISGNSVKDDDLFIDYNNRAVDIERFVRALNPFLLASTMFRHNLVKIFTADVEEGDSSKYPIGTVAKVEGDKLYIATKEGFLLPTSLQFGSFFVGGSRDFIRLLNPQVGEEFE